MQKHRHDPANPVEARHDRPHLFARENHGKFRGLLRAHDVLHPAKFLPKNLLVEKQNRAQGLILRRRRHVAGHGKMREERLNLDLAHFARVPLAVEDDEAANPVGVSLLGADAVVAHPDRVTHPIEETRRSGRGRTVRIRVESDGRDRRMGS